MSPQDDGELPGATATATPETDAQVPPGGGLGEPAPGEDESTAAPPADEGAPPADEDQPPAPLPEGWQEHPDAKPILQQHYNRGRGERESQLRQEMDRREQRYDTEVQEAFQKGTAAEVVTRVIEALQETFPANDEEGLKGLNKLLRGHASWADVFTDTRAEAAEAKLVRDVKGVYRDAGLPDEAVGELSDLEGELSWKVRHGEATLAECLRELIGASYKHVKALGVSQEKERRDKLERERTDATARAKKRQEQPPPPVPAGGGGGGGERKPYKALTADEARKLTPQEIDAQTREFINTNA